MNTYLVSLQFPVQGSVFVEMYLSAVVRPEVFHYLIFIIIVVLLLYRHEESYHLPR